MADNLRPGERVSWNQGAGDTYVVEPLNGYIVRVRNERTGESWFPRRQDLTRISPAVPQAKFRVGQEVRRVLYGMSGKPMEVIAIRVFEYECRDHEGYHFRIGEDGLEAVPEVCPTCGGKVADAD